MCTVVILRRPDHAWPLLLAANRDEMASRPWKPPGRHWPDRADVVAGIDVEAGGTWLGLNDTGVVAGILNRRGSLGRDAKLRSRGELPLEALDHADAVDAAAALGALDGRAWRSFNMVIADNRDAFWIKSLGPDGDGTVTVRAIPEGLHMLTSGELDDAASGRIATFLPKFRAAAVPVPDAGDWRAWEALLAARGEGPETADQARESSMTVVTETGFGTLSASLIALPAATALGVKPIWRFAAGRPGVAPFQAVAL
jgi:uncharacterized protein with NRDE domain